MQSWKRSVPGFSLVPYIIYLVGCLYIVYLASSIQPDLFFSGDGGVKYLVVRQINEGGGFKYLHLTQPEWVQHLWQSGFFPLKEPFTYPSEKGYIISFPPAFQIITAFLSAAFGYAGIYIIPIGSILLLWACFLLLLTYLGIGTLGKSAGLFLLIFCSPLTVYAATYWEHTLAVLLLFSGVVFIAVKKTIPLGALLLGALSGMAVWLRPEALVMNFLYACAVLFLFKKQGKKNALIFLAALSAGIIGFFIMNYSVYGTFLGAHSFQVLEEHTWIYKILRGVKYMFVINGLLIAYFSIVLLCIPVGIIVFKRRYSLPTELILLCGVLFLFCVLTPFIVPNTGGGQWGPRYLLPAVPLALVVLLMARQNDLWPRSPYFIPLMVIITLYSFYLNVYQGGMNRIVKENHQRIKPAMDVVKQNDDPVIVVSSEFIPMEMAALFRDRYFFLAERTGKLDSLKHLLRQQGIKKYLYVTDKKESPGWPNLLNNADTGLLKKGVYYMGEYSLTSP